MQSQNKFKRILSLNYYELMRTYFDFTLKGRHIFPYFFGGFLLLAGIVYLFYKWSASMGAQIYLNSNYLLFIGVNILESFLTMLITMSVTFFAVSLTVKGLSLREDRFECDYDFGKFLTAILPGVFFSAITLGLYYPWLLVKVIRYFSRNTYFRYNGFGFQGTAMNLFSLMVLFALLPAVAIFIVVFSYSAALSMGTGVPMWVTPIIYAVLFCLCMYQAFFTKWLVNFSHGSKKIVADIKIWHMTWFFVGQSLLCGITLGLYIPMAALRSYRYIAGRIVVGEDMVEERLGFTMLAWKDYFYLLGQMLLTLVTAGIYGAWAYARISTRILKRTYVDVIENSNKPMPVRD